MLREKIKMDQYLARIKAIIVEKTGVDPDEVDDNSFFEEDLNIDELELVDIYGAIEEEYHVEFTEEEKEEIESVMELVEALVEKVE